MIKIEFLEPVMEGRTRYESGDIATVPDEFAQRACGAGWAKAVGGEIETGERRVVRAVRAVVQPHGSTVGHEVRNG